MGIKALLQYLRELNPAIVQSCDLTEMSGYRIAIDLAILAYQKKSQYISKTCVKLDLVYEEVDYVAARDYMLRQILRVMYEILIAGCIPVGVFDGLAPDLKVGTKRDRAAKAAKRRRNIDGLRRICRGLLGNTPFALSEEDITFVKGFEKKGKSMSTIDDLRKQLQTEIKGHIVVTSDDYYRLGAIFSAIGMPHIYAPSEAEQTCAAMARHRDVLAVLTTDSDCLVYGCPIMISKFISSASTRVTAPPKVECYSFNNVLKVTQLTNTQFYDFSIMLGTDFNKNSKGYGPVFIYDLIMEYGSITRMIERKKELTEIINFQPWTKLTKIERSLLGHDFDVLNYDKVRCFFSMPIIYDKNALKVRIVEDQFERAFNSLNQTIGADFVLQIMDICKKIIDKLHSVSKFCKHKD